MKNLDSKEGRTAEERTKRTSDLYGSCSGKSIEL